MKYEAKSIVIGRMPRAEGSKFKTLFVKIFDVADPLAENAFPVKEVSFENTEKVLFKNCTPIYFLEGNDLLINNVSSVDISISGDNCMSITCEE